MEKIILLLVVFSSVYMTGLVWFVQVVHYFLFNQVGQDAFKTYESLHTVRTGYVVAPVMVLELGVTIALLVYRPAFVSLPMAGILVGITGLIWLSTFFIQVPLHAKLHKGFEKHAYTRLVRSNWIRTFFWSLKSLLCFWLMAEGMA